MRVGLALLFVSMFWLASCNESVPNDGSARILAIGDSLVAWQSTSGEAIPDKLEQELGEEVIDRSVTGSYMTPTVPVGAGLGLAIPQQYRTSEWDWVIVNGGGNDLRFGCGCRRCDKKLDELLSSDGRSGAIPQLVQRIRADGAQVIYLGYMLSPGVISAVDVCINEGTELEKRLIRMAASDPGVHYLSNANLVPHGDRSFHDEDMIHPSLKARQEIANRLARIIQE